MHSFTAFLALAALAHAAPVAQKEAPDHYYEGYLEPYMTCKSTTFHHLMGLDASTIFHVYYLTPLGELVRVEYSADVSQTTPDTSPSDVPVNRTPSSSPTVVPPCSPTRS